jgi:hypothetical protein
MFSFIVYSNFCGFRQKSRRQKVLDRTVASITRINLLLISSWMTFWLVAVIPKFLNCDSFSNAVSYLYVPILTCILVTRQQHGITTIIIIIIIIIIITTILYNIQV